VRLEQLVYLTAEPTHKTSHNKLHICLSLVQATLLDHINLNTPLNTVYILNRTFHVIIFVKRIGHLVIRTFGHLSDKRSLQQLKHSRTT